MLAVFVVAFELYFVVYKFVRNKLQSTASRLERCVDKYLNKGYLVEVVKLCGCVEFEGRTLVDRVSQHFNSVPEENQGH